MTPLLIFNAGSSSLKLALFVDSLSRRLVFSKGIDRIGSTQATFALKGNDESVGIAAPHQASGLDDLLQRLAVHEQVKTGIIEYFNYEI